MSEEQNKAIVRRFFEEVWNQQKDDVIDEIFASTIVFNGQSRADRVRSRFREHCPPGGHSSRQDPQGREARGYSDRAADDV